MTGVAWHNIKFLNHSDQGGRGDGVQVRANATAVQAQAQLSQTLSAKP